MANSKRRRLGDLLSPKPAIDTSANNTLQQQPRAPESAATNAASRQNTHITPIQNTGQVPNVDTQRSLAVNENTGEVIDDETGEVLTVTTTTTTVTKTETRRSASPLPPPQNGETTIANVQSAPQTIQQHLDPARALQPPNDMTQQMKDSAPQQQRSFEMDANQRPNSIITSQTPGSPLPPQGAPPKSARENLKMAATGLQDARNTIKGALNDGGVPIPRRNPARSSRFPSTQPPFPPAQQAPPVPPVPQQAPGKSQWQAPWPDPPSSNDSYPTAQNDDLGLKKRKSLSSMPASFSPESSGQLGREKSPRLFKRSKGKKGFL